MRFIIIMYANIFLLLNFAMAHKEPAQISGLAMFDDLRPLEVHVFCSLPLLQETFEMDFLGVDLYYESQEDLIKKFILDKKDKFINFEHAGHKLPIFLKDVQLSYDKNDEKLPPGMHFVSDVDLTIIFLFSTPLDIKELTGEWIIFPDVLLDLQKEYGENPDPSNYEISLTYVADNPTTFTSSSSNPSFTWKNRQPNSTKIQVTFLEKKVVIETHLENVIKTLIIGGVLIFLYWTFSTNVKIRKPITILAIVNLLAYVYVNDLDKYDFQKTASLPEGEQLDQLLKNRLGTIYNSLTKKNADDLYEQLGNATNREFLHETFVELHESIFVNTEILKIVDTINIQEARKISENITEAKWSIQAFIRHKNHVHKKDLSYSARFTFEHKDDSWFIADGKILPVYEVAQNDKN